MKLRGKIQFERKALTQDTGASGPQQPAGSTAGSDAAGLRSESTLQFPLDAQGREIMCPVLRAWVADGRLKMNADGNINLDQLKKVLADQGGTPALGSSLWGIGVISNKFSDVWHNLKNHTLNVLQLHEGTVPHPGDTLILRNGHFDEQKFQAFTSHAKDGWMSVGSIAAAIAANTERDVTPRNFVDATVRGLNFATVEFGGLLAVYGSKNPQTGELGIAVDDLRQLYQNGVISDGLRRRQGSASLVKAAAVSASLAMKADAKLAAHAFGSIATAVGLSRLGARLSGDRKGDGAGAAAQLAAMGAGKAGNCPALNGSIVMPTTQAQTVNAHTPAGMQLD